MEQQTKITNDFIELITDLETAKKKEKKQEYKAFYDMLLANAKLFQAKYDYFVEHK